VEIDEKIAWLAGEYFNLKEDEATIYINDGRSFLETENAGLYDIILADAYQDITVPFHMSTVEFFQSVKKHLKPGGILIVNINMRSGDFEGIPEYLAGTVKSCFNSVYRVDLTNVTNSVLFVSDIPNMLENYEKNTRTTMSEDHDLYSISRYVGNNISEVEDLDLILTDDLAPVEILGQKSLNKIVEQELEYYRSNLKGKGLKDIMDMLSQ
jgi:SAM-dependent methyltransferase